MHKRPFTVWVAQVLLSIYFLVILIGTFTGLGLIEPLKILAGFPTGSPADVLAEASVVVCISAALIEFLLLLALWSLHQLNIGFLTLEFAVRCICKSIVWRGCFIGRE